MAKSSILLKNLIPLVVGNILGGKNLLIFCTIIVTIHLTDLPGTSVSDVTPNHNLSTSKFDCLLGDPWSSNGSIMDVASLLVALANPLHLLFRHIEDVCNFSRRLGLESLDDQHFGFWFDLGHIDRSNVEH